ncbi:unnamed protein product [Amoebophrya sp. A120]|nr:unnamed protein product [Amoebophrya sp. A120]|eukprot:GSA120T00013779001.1
MAGDILAPPYCRGPFSSVGVWAPVYDGPARVCACSCFLCSRNRQGRKKQPPKRGRVWPVGWPRGPGLSPQAPPLRRPLEEVRQNAGQHGIPEGRPADGSDELAQLV